MIRIAALALAAALSLAVSGTAADDSLYRDLGGAEGVEKLANLTTDNFLADDRIKHSWDQSDMVRFRKMLAEQFCAVSGGPCTYTGHSMVEAHKGLHLTSADFNAVVEDLQHAMETLGIPFRTQNRFLALLAPMHRDIVTR